MPVNSYKLKEDLVGLARALKIADTGTIANLTERIKQHLLENPNLVDNPRFSGLFTSRRHRHVPCPPPQPQTFSMVDQPPSESTIATTQPAQEQLRYYPNHYPTNYYYNYPPYTS